LFLVNKQQTISFFLISSQNSGYCKRNFICNGSIEIIDDQFSPHNSSSCSSSSNAEDSLNCTVKNEQTKVLSTKVLSTTILSAKE
jgi:hypothetical protein